MAVPNHKQTVEIVRAGYPTKPSRNQCVEICNEVAWVHRAEGFGIAEKTSGTYGERSDGQKAAIDGIVYKPPKGGTEQFVDVLGNAEGENPPWAVPQWDEHASSNRKWVKPIQPSGGPTPPDPEPPPSDDYVTRSEFELHKRNEDQKYDALKAELTQMIAMVARDLAELENRVALLEGAGPNPPVIVEYQLVADATAAPIRTSRDAFHVHEFRAAVVPKP